MWRWLTNLFSKRSTSSDRDGGDRLVSDADYDFRFGTKSKLPKGLHDLEISEVDGRILILNNFRIELTIDQKYTDQTPESIAMASRCLRWAKAYHGLAEIPQLPIRLHQGNIALMSTGFEQSVKDDLILWLCQFGWPLDRPVSLWQLTTKRPLEDGFFTCARVMLDELEDASGLPWQKLETASTSAVDVLTDFVRHEVMQPWGTHRDGSGQHWQLQSCEQYLCSCYAHAPRDQLTHPVFSMLHFPSFDMGVVLTTFAGSVWSGNELRLWSRPTYYHN